MSPRKLDSARLGLLDVPGRAVRGDNGTNVRPRRVDRVPDARRQASLRRGVARIYYRECNPHQRATVAVDNTDLDRPRLVEVAPDPRQVDPCDLTIDAYGHGIESYLAAGGATPPSVLGYLDRFAAAAAGGHVLELGSGPGTDADHLESRGLRVERTDATPAFVERLRARGHRARLLDARAEDYGGPFDGVYANAVLLHLSRKQLERSLRTAWCAARPGGVLAVTLKEGDGAGWSTAKLDRPRHFTYWRADSMAEVCAHTGWVVDTIEHYEGRLEPWLFLLARAGASSPRGAGLAH